MQLQQGLRRLDRWQQHRDVGLQRAVGFREPALERGLESGCGFQEVTHFAAQQGLTPSPRLRKGERVHDGLPGCSALADEVKLGELRCDPSDLHLQIRTERFAQTGVFESSRVPSDFSPSSGEG